MNVVIKENYLGGGLNKAVILLKCAAALLITYSHMGFLFPQYGSLVTRRGNRRRTFLFLFRLYIAFGAKKKFPELV